MPDKRITAEDLVNAAIDQQITDWPPEVLETDPGPADPIGRKMWAQTMEKVVDRLACQAKSPVWGSERDRGPYRFQRPDDVEWS